MKAETQTSLRPAPESGTVPTKRAKHVEASLPTDMIFSGSPAITAVVMPSVAVLIWIARSALSTWSLGGGGHAPSAA
jgi:hypothetical protein